ncbi:hypothetical protein TWF192_005735 [Orbilia oligospora]|uniref:Uncharacterized protein n=1 Tax=Orbilia oligospora TaxID=2813651 RepID=A0A6G1MMQ3_ORBOL|nr:hypothetical protein TWF191_003904 [Orbilia oligospora]KAF3263454.1 hypothetical protein TWF192_005735 [Orbilia oligospora]
MAEPTEESVSYDESESTVETEPSTKIITGPEITGWPSRSDLLMAGFDLRQAEKIKASGDKEAQRTVINVCKIGTTARYKALDATTELEATKSLIIKLESENRNLLRRVLKLKQECDSVKGHQDEQWLIRIDEKKKIIDECDAKIQQNNREFSLERRLFLVILSLVIFLQWIDQHISR